MRAINYIPFNSKANTDIFIILDSSSFVCSVDITLQFTGSKWTVLLALPTVSFMQVQLYAGAGAVRRKAVKSAFYVL